MCCILYTEDGKWTGEWTISSAPLVDDAGVVISHHYDCSGDAEVVHVMERTVRGVDGTRVERAPS